MTSETPFSYVAHAIVVPVRVDDGVDTRFVLDTGIGLNLIFPSLCERVGCTTSGETRGKRMSGQELVVPLARLRSLEMGSRREDDVEVGVYSVGLPPAFAGIDGFLSLRFFERAPFTIDYARRVVVLETVTTLAARTAAGAVVPVRVDRSGASLTLFMPFDVSAGSPALVEVDTGSDDLILNSSFLARLGIDPAGPDVRVSRGTDETNRPFLRWHTKLRSPVFPVAAPAMRLEASPVMFADIIHDGLVGHSFLKNFVVTYDVSGSRMILSRP